MKTGFTVRLKSGGPIMTVEHTTEQVVRVERVPSMVADWNRCPSERPIFAKMIKCVWWDEGKQEFRRESFPEDTLEQADGKA